MSSRNAAFLPPISSSDINLDGVDILLHHHYPEIMFSDHYLAATSNQIQNAATLVNQDLEDLNGDPAPASQVMPAATKDRHSKIFTAHGPRDRRVRLSIDIARKFFDLQEMLGFDKPSKTLDWLLNKSRAAIRELVQNKQNGSSSSPSDECEELSSAGNGDEFENGAKSRMTLSKNSKDPQQLQGASNLAKKTRAKARARARERTWEKNCIKQLSGGAGPADLSPNVPIQLEDFQLSAASSSNTRSCSFDQANPGLYDPLDLHYSRVISEDLIPEPAVVKRSPNDSFLGFQQYLVTSRGMNSNYNIPSNSNTYIAAGENWDFSSFTSQSIPGDIWDHHKFVNSSNLLRSFWRPLDE